MPSAPSGFVLGIDFGGTKVALGTATPAGELLETARLDNAGRDAGAVVAHALEAAGDLLRRTTASARGRLLAVGAVSPGIIAEDGVRLAPNVRGWEQLRLPSRLRDALDTDRVACGNDVKAAALAEARWGALRGADPGVFLNLGTGVAAGVVAGGRVLTGAHGAAGEIGYSLRSHRDAAGVHARRAPLEEAALGRAVGEGAGAGHVRGPAP